MGVPVSPIVGRVYTRTACIAITAVHITGVPSTYIIVILP